MHLFETGQPRLSEGAEPGKLVFATTWSVIDGYAETDAATFDPVALWQTHRMPSVTGIS
jgi:hypothetical protein